MQHYENRKQRVHIISLDRVLATDVYARLREYRELLSWELLQPGQSNLEITVDDIEALAIDTTSSKLLIFDVRSQNLSQLQHAYNRIIGYNRADFNSLCYTVVIGDGPVGQSQSGTGMGSFHAYFDDIRINYSPAVFFGDPLLNYSFAERREMTIYRDDSQPARLPRRLEKYFRGEDITVEQVRKYFRAANVEDKRRLETKKERQKVLERVYSKVIEEEFGEEKEQFTKALTKEGCAVPGESLRLNIYPVFFEDWVLDLIRKPKQAE
ncbi:MAG: hypothetical protein ACYS1A_14310 [Planctomycetota bacterium]|jgi:hypothetical protein